MAVEKSFGVYHALESLLRSSKKPLTSVECYDNPVVRKYAEDVNAVSDYLGHMFRRGLLDRESSRGIGQAKWAYTWKRQRPGQQAQTPMQRHAQPRLVVSNTEHNGIRITEHEDGSVSVITGSCTVIIKPH